MLELWAWMSSNPITEIRNAPFLLVTDGHSLKEDQRLMGDVLNGEK